ncbi:ribonuclease D [Hugonella massiliensis]|uniref:ribonuclease D n=1 Tax=Hugonella massiliensis TaxID=1720315 RepID=UPI00073E9A29|nr:ribonuclease D [Hugonella massiliensis]
MFITDQADLESFATRACGSSLLAIDTEFLREKTYYAKLCLLQMQTDEETVIVDPFAVDDLTVLADVFTNPGVLKLFHAGSQDIEILYRVVGVMPTPIFDTQLAAALLGHTQQIGYGALVNLCCGVQLKKIDSYTDWSRRPLSPSQVNYAADDVVYLPAVYRKVSGQLASLGRTHWLDPDFAELVDPKKYAVNERDRYRRLKRVGQLKPRQLSAARELAEWRELKAERSDIPRKWVMTDEQIVEACKREARSIDELFMVRGLSDKLSTRDARAVVACIVRGLDTPMEDWPEHARPSRNEANVDVVVDLMSAVVRKRARESNIAFQTLCNHSDLAKVARGYRDVAILQGWRRDIVGNELLDLLAGRLCVFVREDTVEVTKR